MIPQFILYASFFLVCLQLAFIALAVLAYLVRPSWVVMEQPSFEPSPVSMQEKVLREYVNKPRMRIAK